MEAERAEFQRRLEEERSALAAVLAEERSKLEEHMAVQKKQFDEVRRRTEHRRDWFIAAALALPSVARGLAKFCYFSASLYVSAVCLGGGCAGRAGLP